MKKMEDRITDKIEEIESYLSELLEATPNNLEEYLENFVKKAACERFFEKIVEAVVDVVFLIIKKKKLKIPDDDESSFYILSDEKIISEELAKKLKQAKGMRNIIAHEYGKINDELVFEAVKNELESDVREFIKYVRKLK